MSDTLSLSSFGGGPLGSSGPGILAEDLGSLILHPDFVCKKVVLLNSTLAALNEDGSKILLGELRSRGEGEWSLGGRSVSLIDKANEKKYIDLALLPGMKGSSSTKAVFLAERIKNKERLLVVHEVSHGKTLELGEEAAFYDKANVLGKGVSHISPDLVSGDGMPPTIYAASNLLRKLIVEENALRPTPARSTVPQEALEGTIALTVQASSKSSKSHYLVGAFRTKSATKNKFMVEWFLSNQKKDELSCCKTPLKLSEDTEPLFLLSDPKDPRTVYILVKTGSHCALHKLTKGFSSSRREDSDEPLLLLPGPVEAAGIGVSGEGNSTLLLVLEGGSSARLFSLTKSEGFRGRQPICAHCPSLERFFSPSHVISCASPNQKWQISPSVLGPNVNHHQICLASLLEDSGKFVAEPETGLPYRLRILGCETQGVHSEMILLEDLSRTFENAEDKLSQMSLRLALNYSPCRECQSHLSGWLMSGKLARVELQYVPSGGEVIQDFGERFGVKAINMERFKSFITDTDWSMMFGNGGGKQGTFTKAGEDASPLVRSVSGKSPRSSLAPGSRIPTRAGPGGGTPPSNGGMSHSLSGCLGRPEILESPLPPSVESSNLRDLLSTLSASLQNALSMDANLRSSLISLESGLQQIQSSLDPQ